MSATAHSSSLDLPHPLPVYELPPPGWNLTWLTPLRCRLILALVLLAGFVSRLHWLMHNCPVDLAGDEAQYWDWSRRLDLCYYSKGPLIAYIIRASCALFGNTMPAVRLPALLIGVGTSLITYALVKRLFSSERLALGAVLLTHLAPMFIAGGFLMTIDSPLYFCWALATYLAARALFDRSAKLWPLIGLVVGIGALAKYAMLLWLPIVGIMLCTEPRGRGVLKTAGPYLASVIALLCLTPVVIWNARHGWVSFHHVARQTGVSGGGVAQGNFLETLLTQIGLLGPALAVLTAVAVYHAFRPTPGSPVDLRERFLVWIGVLFLLINLGASFITKVQANWPVPAYFTLLILTARFLATRLRSKQSWRPWRGWFYGAILTAIIFTPLALDPSRLFPVVRPVIAVFNPESTDADLANLDLLQKLRGWSRLGAAVSDQLHTLPPGSFVLCDDYQQTAEMAFYVQGQPATYCAGPYFEGASAKRLTQYDMWPDRRLDPSSPLVGRDAIYVGKGGPLPSAIRHAFKHIEAIPDVDIVVRGIKIRSFHTWKCFGFRGMSRTTDQLTY